MDLSLYGITPRMTAASRDPELRAFARWEYGRTETAWLARTAARAPRARVWPRFRGTLRRWISTLRAEPAPTPVQSAEE